MGLGILYKFYSNSYKMVTCTKTAMQTNSAYTTGIGQTYRIPFGQIREFTNFPTTSTIKTVIPLYAIKSDDITFSLLLSLQSQNFASGQSCQVWGLLGGLNANYTAYVLVIYQ